MTGGREQLPPGWGVGGRPRGCGSLRHKPMLGYFWISLVPWAASSHFVRAPPWLWRAVSLSEGNLSVRVARFTEGISRRGARGPVVLTIQRRPRPLGKPAAAKSLRLAAAAAASLCFPARLGCSGAAFRLSGRVASEVFWVSTCPSRYGLAESRVCRQLIHNRRCLVCKSSFLTVSLYLPIWQAFIYFYYKTKSLKL